MKGGHLAVEHPIASIFEQALEHWQLFSSLRPCRQGRQKDIFSLHDAHTHAGREREREIY